MKSQTPLKKPGTGDTVSITVSITQDARKKLREMKGILAYPTLDKTINTAVDMVEMRKVFDIAMNAHGLMSQVELVSESIQDDSISISNSLTSEDKARLDFCQTLLDRFERQTIQELLDSKEMMINSETLNEKGSRKSMSEFCKRIILKFELLDMQELNAAFDSGEIEIIDHRED